MKIFFLVSRFPYPIEKGDKLRAFYQIKGLSDKGHQIVLCALTDKAIHPDAKNVLSHYCDEIHVFKLSRLYILPHLLFTYLFSNKSLQVSYFFNKKIQAKINQLIKKTKPEHIFCQLVRTSEYVKRQSIPKTLDYMDALSKGMERQVNKSPFYMKPFLQVEALRLKRYEHKIFNYFNNHSIISEQDKDLIVNIKKENIEVLPNGIDTKKFNSSSNIKKKYDILFTGNMSYPPNIDAAVFLIEQLMPLIWKENKNIKLMIAGANPAKAITKHKNKTNIFISGWVDDLCEIYNQSLIFAAPLFIGTGLQNKLLEAMAMQLPCITTSSAGNALIEKEENAIIIAEEVEKYVKHILMLIRNENKRNEITKINLQYVKDHYTWEKTNKQLEELIINSN